MTMPRNLGLHTRARVKFCLLLPSHFPHRPPPLKPPLRELWLERNKKKNGNSLEVNLRAHQIHMPEQMTVQ